MLKQVERKHQLGQGSLQCIKEARAAIEHIAFDEQTIKKRDARGLAQDSRSSVRPIFGASLKVSMTGVMSSSRINTRFRQSLRAIQNMFIQRYGPRPKNRKLRPPNPFFWTKAVSVLTLKNFICPPSQSTPWCASHLSSRLSARFFK